jgi:hypothetical protein
MEQRGNVLQFAQGSGDPHSGWGPDVVAGCDEGFDTAGMWWGGMA